MAPSYRNPNRRQNRQGVDHGELEGMPVRHWRRDFVTVAPPPTQDSTASQNDIWAIELPHGMPKDSHLLPQHSQDLLRAARSGKIYKRPAPADEEEADPEIIVSDKPEKKDDDLKEKGFTAKSWKPIPRHLEGADVGYLAKRRKNLVTASSKPLAPVPTVIKATVKRIDAAGNEYVQDIVVPKGQQVEGEVIAQTQIPDPNAIIDPAAVQATPPRRRPTSKKKSKGSGRSKKKKQAAPTSAPQVVQAEGSVPVPSVDGTVGPDGVKVESEVTSTPANNEDTEMGDGSQANSDDEEGDEGEDGDEGDDDEGSIDIQDSPSKQPQQSPLSSISPLITHPVPPLEPVDTTMGGTEFSLAPPRLLTERSEGKSGSPLKNVALTTSTLTSPLESPSVLSAPASFQDLAPLGEANPVPLETKLEALDEEMQQEVADLAPSVLPPPPPEPTAEEATSAVEVLQEEKEEEEMLLDILDNARQASIGAPIEPAIASTSPVSQNTIVQAEPIQQSEAEVAQISTPPVLIPEPAPEEVPSSEKPETPTEQTSQTEPAPTPVSVPAPISEPAVEEPPAPAAEDDDDDDYPDLLGGLEKSLKTPEARIETPVAEKTPEVEKEAVVEAGKVEEEDKKEEGEPSAPAAEELLLQ